MKKLKNILKYCASIFLVILVSLCIYTFVITDVLKKDYVNVFGYTYFVVASGSMSGTIEVDDIIFVKITKDVKNDDVITFKSDDGDIITHRLIGMKDGKYITKGDVNNVTDEAVSEKQIIGKVTLIVSPSFILKSIAIFLIVFILLALVNFDKIIKKYILRSDEENKENKTPVNQVPESIFKNPNGRPEEPSSGLTVTIAIDEMEALEKMHEKEEAVEDSIEVLDFEDEEPSKEIDEDEEREKEIIDFIVSILKCKKNNVAKARMNKKWLTKYQYVYKLCQLLLENNIDQVKEEIINPPFKEIYDYDLERVGLTESIRNKLYDLPISAYLRILTYSILYNDDEMFDGVYKILKYKVMVDKYNQYLELAGDKKNQKEIKSIVTFMKKVSNRFDNKNVFELDKIERLTKIGKY